ncbi:hypothetical protein [Polycladomyces subterraneus]|uniref:Uncharacterized protein n=1 Tax=Polycladomyces subterraneus TaxID=1016997 RepID=A0ABT8IJY5_9BACL|nr:hypothetical protein [Polycladomyces subterraneus]MDN4592697.1 hypothetical protein [Polycladomyces subterraneus]
MWFPAGSIPKSGLVIAFSVLHLIGFLPLSVAVGIVSFSGWWVLWMIPAGWAAGRFTVHLFAGWEVSAGVTGRSGLPG